MAAHIREHPLAMLAVNGADGPVIAMVPMVFDAEKHELTGHIFRGNPLVSMVDGEIAATALFQGPQGYISPSWYPSKATHGKAVPTWNYVTVVARGTLSLERDPQQTAAYLEALTEQMEAGRDAPWQVHDAPSDYISLLHRGILGVRLNVSFMQGIAKLSQDRPEADFKGVLGGLQRETNPAAHMLSEEMRKKTGIN